MNQRASTREEIRSYSGMLGPAVGHRGPVQIVAVLERDADEWVAGSRSQIQESRKYFMYG